MTTLARTLAASLAAAVMAFAISACGDDSGKSDGRDDDGDDGGFQSDRFSIGSKDPGETTCGEYLDKSESERKDFIEDAAEDEGDEAAEALDSLGGGDEAITLVAQVFTSVCENSDADTELDDVDPNDVDPADLQPSVPEPS